MVSLKNETIAVKCETIMRREMNQKLGEITDEDFAEMELVPDFDTDE